MFRKLFQGIMCTPHDPKSRGLQSFACKVAFARNNIVRHLLSLVVSPLKLLQLQPRGLPAMSRKRRIDDESGALMRQLAGLGIPQQKLARALPILKDHKPAVDAVLAGLPPDGSEKVRRALRDATTSLAEPIMMAEDIVLSNRSIFRWEFLSPTKIMVVTLCHNASLRSEMLKLMRQHNGRLSLIWTADDTFSENPLHEARRTMWVASFTFAEWSRYQLALSDFWWTPAVFRTKVVHLVDGGYSRLSSSLLHHQLLGAEDGLQSVGLPIHFDGAVYVLFARFNSLVADGDAWKVILECKGASGLRPCLVCQNCWAKGSDVAHRRPGHIEITAADPAQFQEHTVTSLRETVEHVFNSQLQRSRRMITAEALKNVEKSCGVSPTLDGIWVNNQLVAALRLP